MLNELGNGYISGFSPNEEGSYSFEFSVTLGDSSVYFEEQIVVIEQSSTPSLIIPKKVNTIQFTEFEVPFYVENINDESVHILSNFPSWIEITSLNNNEFLLRGRPEGNMLGEYIFKLSARTFAGLTDSTDI